MLFSGGWVRVERTRKQPSESEGFPGAAVTEENKALDLSNSLF